MNVVNMTPSEALTVYRARAPVCVCAGPRCADHFDGPASWCGPRRSAERAARVLALAGYVWPEHYLAALTHARMGEGRAEWDALPWGPA